MGKRMTDLHGELSRDDEYHEAYEGMEEEFQIASAMIEARKKAGLTQKQLAERMGVSQPAVAKMESGRSVSIATLKRYARATDTRLHVSFEA